MKTYPFEAIASKMQGLQRLAIRYTRPVQVVLWALIFAQAVVVSWVARPFTTGDSGRYLELSHNLLAGKGYVVSCGGQVVSEGWRLPGYPLFLAGVAWLFGPSLDAVVVCQMGLYLASIFLLYRLAKHLGPSVPAIFLLLCAAYPAVAYASALIMSEAVCVFLVTAAFYLVVRPSWIRCTVAGLAFGAATYCRPNLLLFGLIVALGMVVAQRKIRPAALVAAFSIVALVPLGSWNYAHFRKFTPLPAEGGSGIPLFYGAWESVLPTSELMNFNNGAPPSRLLVKSGMVEQLQEISLTVGAPLNSTFPFPVCSVQRSEQSDSLLRGAVLLDAERWPGAYLWHAARTGVTDWLPTLALRRFPAPLRFLLLIDVVTLPLLGIIGLITLARGTGVGRLLGWTSMAVATYLTVSLGWFISQGRYTVPPRLLLLLGAAALIGRLLSITATGPHEPVTSD